MTRQAQIRRFRSPESPWSTQLNDEQRDDRTSEETPADESVALSQANRSRDNVARWRAYLPESCIRTMIDMGWDRST